MGERKQLGERAAQTCAQLDYFTDKLNARVTLAWMVDRSPEALESSVGRGKMTAAFNMTVLSQLLGTPLQPDLGGHVLMLEEVGEALYRIDRSLFHITQ
jgi:muramoyltetrapeptide carboxypeptidase LdcA involved in peptidoglycan recycling